jgi:hypothetical protein
MRPAAPTHSEMIYRQGAKVAKERRGDGIADCGLWIEEATFLMAGNFVPKVRANDPPLLQGERWRPAGRVTHLAGHLFNRGGAFQAPCPFSLLVKWQDKIETPRRGERRGLRRGEELLVICDWLLGKRIKKRPHQVAGASCSRPSMERPAPCSAPPVPRCFFPSSLETTHLNLETAYFSCFKSTRKCGLGRDRNFFLEIFCLCQHLSHPSC